MLLTIPEQELELCLSILANAVREKLNLNTALQNKSPQTPEVQDAT